MPNMSYCMFENTLPDFIDCVEKLEQINFDVSALSRSECRAAEELINICRDIVNAADAKEEAENS